MSLFRLSKVRRLSICRIDWKRRKQVLYERRAGASGQAHPCIHDRDHSHHFGPSEARFYLVSRRPRAYGDVEKALNFGYLVHHKSIDSKRHH